MKATNSLCRVATVVAVASSLGFLPSRGDAANMHYDWTCAGVVCAAKVFCQFPYSDEPGIYTVLLTDIATGLSTDVKVTVR